MTNDLIKTLVIILTFVATLIAVVTLSLRVKEFFEDFWDFHLSVVEKRQSGWKRMLHYLIWLPAELLRALATTVFYLIVDQLEPLLIEEPSTQLRKDDRRLVWALRHIGRVTIIGGVVFLGANLLQFTGVISRVDGRWHVTLLNNPLPRELTELILGLDALIFLALLIGILIFHHSRRQHREWRRSFVLYAYPIMEILSWSSFDLLGRPDLWTILTGIARIHVGLTLWSPHLCQQERARGDRILSLERVLMEFIAVPQSVARSVQTSRYQLSLRNMKLSGEEYEMVLSVLVQAVPLSMLPEVVYATFSHELRTLTGLSAFLFTDSDRARVSLLVRVFNEFNAQAEKVTIFRHADCSLAVFPSAVAESVLRILREGDFIEEQKSGDLVKGGVV